MSTQSRTADTPAQRRALRLTFDSFNQTLVRLPPVPGAERSCAPYLDSTGKRITATTVEALERRGLLSVHDAPEGGWATITDAGRWLMTRNRP